jgi:hypothetical protein
MRQHGRGEPYNPRVLSVARGLLLALNFLLLSLPPLLEPSLGTTAAFLIVTVVLTVLNISLTVSWERLTPADASALPPAALPALLAGVAAAILIVAASAAWLREIMIYPVDPQRADMLVVIQLAIRRFLQGGNPYATYHVPWEVPLTYGPVMWAPFIAPLLLHADVRFVSLAGVLFVPIACAVAAVAAAASGRRALTLAWLAVLAAIAISPDLRHFVAVAHTPVYWPLLALLAWLTSRDQWRGAALTCGLLIVARTTIVSIAPVLLMAAWYRARPRFPGVAVRLVAATLLPFLPFAIWDLHALQYGLYGTYQKVVKTFVWMETTWVQHTIGTTGPMVTLQWGRAVEAVQAAALLTVYAISGAAIRRGRRPLPWMALSLFVFSMTTLWPVIYLYFDVGLLFVCIALAESAWVSARPVAGTWPALLAASVAAVAVAVVLGVPVNASIDAGTEAGRPSLYAGFSGDERQGDVTFAWIDGTRGEILIPRRSRRDATIVLVCEPYRPSRDTVQRLSASLNGTVIGTLDLKDGWNRVELTAPGRAWQVGVNELILSLSSAVSPRELGLSDDGRQLSLAVDRLMVSTP